MESTVGQGSTFHFTIPEREEVSDERRRGRRAIEILLVEDNPGDVRLTEEALREGKVWNNPHVVTDGEAALDFSPARGQYTDAPRPDLVLLDLNLPQEGRPRGAGGDQVRPGPAGASRWWC